MYNKQFNPFPLHPSLNCGGRLVSLEQPLLMGILNFTPDSFSDGGRFNRTEVALLQIEKMLSEGADIIDIGAYSTRPGAEDVPEEEEINRLKLILPEVVKRFPGVIFSCDTFRSNVAKYALENGVTIINDVSGGTADEMMLETVAKYQAPLVIMHSRGNPKTMQSLTDYSNEGSITEAVWKFFIERINACRAAGIFDLILDPGIGFAKTPDGNAELLKCLKEFTAFGYPLLIGISRKSSLKIWSENDPAALLPLTSALHMTALQSGVKILRVHDVKPARLVRDLFLKFQL